MNKIEITINNVEDLTAALIRLAEALENKQRVVHVRGESGNVDEPSIALEQPTESKEPETVEKPVTLEQVRAVLTAKSQEGKKAAIQGLFKKYGATKLTSVDFARYSELLKDAVEL